MSNKKEVILLSGYAQSGKDTVANYLCEVYDYKKMSIAEPMYDMLIAMYKHIGIDKLQLENMKVNLESLPDSQITVRTMLQTLGTEWGRQYVNVYIWPAILAQKIQVHTENKFVISDCRFTNEFHRLKKDINFNTTLWMIQSATAKRQSQHASEQEIGILEQLADWTVTNNQTFDDLYTKVDVHIML